MAPPSTTAPHHNSFPSITMSRLPRGGLNRSPYPLPRPPIQVTNISPLDYPETMINNNITSNTATASRAVVFVIRTAPHTSGHPRGHGPPVPPVLLPLVSLERGERRENSTRRLREVYEAFIGDRGDTDGGLSEETIGRCLKKRRPCPDQDKEPDHHHNNTGNKVCAVCLEDLVDESSSSSDIKEVDEDMIIGVLDCRHEFHVRCIKQWLRRKNACPLCRATALGRCE